MGKPYEMKAVARPRHRWEENVGMDFYITRIKGVDWIDLAQDRDKWRSVLNTVMNIRVELIGFLSNS